MGTADPEAPDDERPVHKVRISSFWIDATEVTNAQFRAFVQATGYITIAERPPDLADLEKQVPRGSHLPNSENLVAGSLVFAPTDHPVDFSDPSQWWHWIKNADWRHPGGPQSSIDGHDNDPVTQISYTDATVYAAWAGKRLPTEGEWEYAARGGLAQQRYVWGNEEPGVGGKWRANIWQGHFPVKDEGFDGFSGIAPVKSFPPNGFGLYDMAGNVWEWTADWYRPTTYVQETLLRECVDPKGPADSYDPDLPTAPERVIRGGSFLCNAIYCSGYRVSARMKSTPDTSTNHIGFRCVRDIPSAN